MKKSLAGGAALLLAFSPAAFAQDQLYENWAQVIAPSTNMPYAPQIDAITFINHRGALFDISSTSLYTTSDTLNYTNQGVMTGFPGFDFQTFPPAMGAPRMASSFANLASGPGGGELNCYGNLFYGGVQGFFFGTLTANAKVLVRATNIVNSGNINMSSSGLLSLTGKNIDLSRGGMNMDVSLGTQIFGSNVFIAFANSGILDGYWAAENATNGYNPINFATFPVTPFHWVTNRDYLMMAPTLFGQVAYVNDSGEVASNRFVQAVFLNNNNPEFVNSVYFTPQHIAVEYRWTTPDWPDIGALTTNYFFLTDNFGETTNIGVQVNGLINPQAYSPRPTYIPINYQFYQGFPYTFLFGNVPAATPGMLPNVFIDQVVTNQYAAYEALFSPGTGLPTDIAGGAYSNMPGRIEIRADTSLNLYKSRISTLNYLRLEATNHFRGSQNAVIKTPFADYNLRSTNGFMSISNIIAPFIARPKGPCDLYSARWTNIVNSVTNAYHVLFVESALDSLIYPEIANLKLAVTDSANQNGPKNLLINDLLNVSTGMELRAERITIATNDASSFTPFGQLNLTTFDVVWPTATPGLQYLTNWGSIGMRNAVYFGGSRTQPPYNGQPDIPYQAFVNHGSVTNQGSIIWANYFENDGVFDAGNGSIVLQNSSQAVLNGGSLYAPLGQVSLYASSLAALGVAITAGGPLELSPTNSLTDGGVGTNSIFGSLGLSVNTWTTTSGFSLLNKPAVGDLLATTVINTAADYQETLNYWAGADRGNSASGFQNNGAVGRLVLSGGTDSAFRFTGTGGANAMYVDLLDLRGSVTNRDAYGNFIGLNIDPNMKIYFADAVANGKSVAEKLDGRNGGRLIWVNSYAGTYSSTNLLYPDGKMYSFNRALVQSCNLDSDDDGIANCSDATPCLMPGIVQLSIALTNQPAGARLLTWATLARSTNYIYYKTSPSSTNWLLLTNFVFGPNNGKAAVLDTATSSTRYYRARVDAGQP